ncbi:MULTISPECIES: hypothetical protein [unclassified Chryseobacterium]|uniref:hypothetical protein n=1 Tax=Chryseobacterium sp. R2A-55 TaxID=2744445 RepID=UPI001F46885B|nr:hypothetical protein [Chryseobacterium sp. R2A-55]
MNVSKTITTLLLVLFIFTISWAQQKNDCHLGNGKERALRGICSHVISPELYDGEYSYVTKFKKAAGVTPEDSEEEMYRKIREVWDKYEDCLICDTIAFSLRGGSILKAATVSLNKNFYNTVIKWGVNLNRIDTVDGKTVLDFIQDKIAINPPNIEFYRAYYNVLKEHGAKHAADILAEKNN